MTQQHYHGSCQCGAVQFEVTIDLEHSITCNCSRCQRLGSVLAFTPASNFELKRGQDAVTEYLFNKQTIHHLFCKTCGIESFARATGKDGIAMVAVNANCLDGVEPRKLPSQHVDGRSF